MSRDHLIVEPVKDRKGLLEFIRLPWRIYQNDPYWVPPLLSEQKVLFNQSKNPFYQHARIELFLGIRDQKVVGRIAAFVNDNHNTFHQDKVGFFGFFECLKDEEVSNMLLSTARDWLKEQGMDTMRGPLNFSTNEECALLIDGFDSSPVIMMTYNPRYYVDFMDSFGLEKGRDLLAYYMQEADAPPEHLQSTLEKIRKRAGITIRPLNMKDFQGEIQRVKEVYNLAWSRNWGFVPMTDEEIIHMANQLKKIIDPDIVFFAEINDRPIGFSLALPDINQALKKINGRLFPFGLLKLLWHAKKIDGVRVPILGVIHEYQNKGIAAMFGVETFKAGTKKGYIRGEMSWILEDNDLIIKALERMGAKVYKTYRIYEMAT